MGKRTTVTFDEALLEQLAREARRNGETLRATLDRVIRRGLHPPRLPEKSKRFRVRARDLGLRPGISLDNIEQLLDQSSGPWRR